MTRIPDYLVEKVHLGECTPEERARVLADADARARLEALPAQDRAFFEAYPVDEELRRIGGRARTAEARARSGPSAARYGVMLAPLLGALVALVWVGASLVEAPPAGPLDDPAAVDPRPEPTTPKGLQPVLHVYRLRERGPESLRTGALAREGDVVQLGVVPGSAHHGVVVSIDGSGAVTIHWPTKGGTTELGSRELRMPGGYELDDAPAFERFFLVTTKDGPTDVTTVVHAAEALAADPTAARTQDLALPEGYAQTAFVLRKEEQ